MKLTKKNNKKIDWYNVIWGCITGVVGSYIVGSFSFYVLDKVNYIAGFIVLIIGFSLFVVGLKEVWRELDLTGRKK